VPLTFFCSDLWTLHRGTQMLSGGLFGAVTDRLYSELAEIHKGAPAGPDKAMRIALYWILFLGQTIGDTTILSHLIPLFRQLVTSGLREKTPPKTLVFAMLGVIIIQACY
jgi:hypothetical protein